MDNVENLSTGIVEKSPVRRCYVDRVENLSTGIVENSPMDDSSVENLSTRIVENVIGGSFIVKSKKAVINVPESKGYPHSLWITW